MSELLQHREHPEQVPVIHPSEATARRVGELCATVGADPYREPVEFVRQCEEAARLLPTQVAAPLDALAAHRGPCALVLRQAVQVPDLPATPMRKFDLDGARTVGTESGVGVLAARLGRPFAYREWDSGQIVQNRYPIASHAAIQSASGSTELLMHTEASFAAISPDHLVLLGLRPDPGRTARTTLAPSERALAMLQRGDLDVLSGPYYAFETDQGTHEWAGRRITEPRPLLSRADGQWRLEFSDLMVATTSAAASAMGRLHGALQQIQVAVLLEPGDVLVIDNRRIVHGRSAYYPRFDGTDRWIQRVLVRRRTPDSELLASDSRFVTYPSSYSRTLSRPA